MLWNIKVSISNLNLAFIFPNGILGMIGYLSKLFNSFLTRSCGNTIMAVYITKLNCLSFQSVILVLTDYPTIILFVYL